MDSYAFGQTVIPRLTFRDRNRNLVDVTDIVVEIQPPVSPPYSYSGPFDHPSIGIYDGPPTLGDEAGIWKGWARGSIAGDGQATDTFAFCVDPEYVLVGS